MVQENLTPPSAPGAAIGPMELKPVASSAPVGPRPPKGSFLSRGNLSLAAMLAAGALGLYALSLRNSPSSAMADQSLVHAKVEAALDVLGAQPTAAEAQRRSAAKAIVSEFYTAARQRQIDERGLKGNPFVFQETSATTRPVEPKNKPKPKPKVPDDLREAMATVRTLELTSVIHGHSTVATISSNVVSVGQTIRGWKVVRIDPTEVELSWKDRTYILRISN